MKKVLFMLVAVVTFALASCSGGAGSAPQPTGDPAVDAKAVADYGIALMNEVKDEASAKDLEKKVKELEETFEKYYEGKDDLKAKLEEEGEKYTNSEEFQKKAQEAAAKMMKVALESMK